MSNRALRSQANWPKGTAVSHHRRLCGDKPYLIVDNSDLPATAHELRDILARSGNLFDRDGPVQVVPSRDGGPPIARRMTPSRIVREAHRLSRPVKLVGEQPVPITLPISVARMYL
jgi:hypothetical protein